MACIVMAPYVGNYSKVIIVMVYIIMAPYVGNYSKVKRLPLSFHATATKILGCLKSLTIA